LQSLAAFVFSFSDLQPPQPICVQQSLPRHTRPSHTSRMDDDESRKLILRLQMEDLATIWVSSTTSTDDDAELDADVSLRLYRQELRTAEQQIEDQRSTQAAAQNEHRQRDFIRADREAARRLFLELNPNEPLPELASGSQSVVTQSSTSDNAPLKSVALPASGLLRFSELSVVSSSPLTVFPHTTIAQTGVKRSVDHLDTGVEMPMKKQVSGGTGPASGQASTRSRLFAQRAGPRSIRSTPTTLTRSVQAPVSSPSTPTSLVRPAPDDFDDGPPAKRRHSSPKMSPLVLENSRSTAVEQPVSAVSGPTASSQTGPSSSVGSFGRQSQNVTKAPLGSGSRFLSSSRANKGDDRTAYTKIQTARSHRIWQYQDSLPHLDRRLQLSQTSLQKLNVSLAPKTSRA
jgi:hypothetical protein